MFNFEGYYYIVLGLQAICAYHCYRKGYQQKYLWLIVFLPVVGCLIYIFNEVLDKRQLRGVQSGISATVNPSGRIKKLENNLKFSDTFNNRILLADAYMESGQIDNAIELYESSLTGAFSENEHVLSQLINAYYKKERFADIVMIARKIYNQLKFQRSREHMLYAMALDQTGNKTEAEKEFKLMNGSFAYYEPRYQFGLFLGKQGRDEEASVIFNEMVEEINHMNSQEKRGNRHWVALAKEELKKTYAS